MTRGAVPIRSTLVAAVVAVAAGLMAPLPLNAADLAPLDLTMDASARPWQRYADWPNRDESKFSTLAKVISPPAPTAPRAITGALVGDAANGQKLVADRTRGGSCLACHVMGQAGDANLPGNVGPDLSQIGNAGRDDEWLFNYVYDARVYNPTTIMPPWGSHGLFSDAEIRDIVAFLKTLKTPATYPTVLDDPAKRPPPVEDRDNLDPLLNPALWAVDKAKDLWAAKGPAGSSCATCHAQPELTFKTWAARMPKWDARLDKVLGVEEFIARHAKATTGQNWLMQSDENTALSVYLHNLAEGVPIAVDVSSPNAQAAYDRGKALNARKIGQLNFSCVDCHAPNRGGLHWIRGQWLGEQAGQYDHFPTWRTSLNAIWDIRKRFQWCQVNIRADELPPDAKEYGDLELYIAAQSAGRALNAPGIRH